MEPLPLDEVNMVTPILTVVDVVETDSDDADPSEEFDARDSLEAMQRHESQASDGSLVVVPLESRTSLGSVSTERRSGALHRMGRDAQPFFSGLLLFAMLTGVLGCFTVGLGITIEVQLGHSHSTWKTSLWWGGLVCFILGIVYMGVHLTIHKAWPLSRFAFAGYQLFMILCFGLMIVSIDQSYETYRDIKGVVTDQCTYINFEGTYTPLTLCYDPCRTHLFNTTGNSNPLSVCCCCSHVHESSIVYFTGVNDCGIVDSTEAKIRYLTVSYVIQLLFIVLMLITSGLVQFGCCKIVPPWAYMKLSAKAKKARYSIN